MPFHIGLRQTKLQKKKKEKTLETKKRSIFRTHRVVEPKGLANNKTKEMVFKRLRLPHLWSFAHPTLHILHSLIQLLTSFPGKTCPPMGRSIQKVKQSSDKQSYFYLEEDKRTMTNTFWVPCVFNPHPPVYCSVNPCLLSCSSREELKELVYLCQRALGRDRGESLSPDLPQMWS